MAQGVNGTNGAPPSDGRPALIHATILFIDLMNSVSLSTALTLREYNTLINEYQGVLRDVITDLRERYSIAEWYLGGDQLAVFFYDPADAGLHERAVNLRRRSPGSPRAVEIDELLRSHRDRGLYGALRCAVNVKNAWTAHPRNVQRVETDQPILDVGIGIHTGNVVLERRGDGALRIEGFAINYAKRVEGFSRHGHFCRIMLSRPAYETFRTIIVQEAMLKQRAFFERYAPTEGMLKGLPAGTEVYELKFFHRLAGFGIPADQIALYSQIFENDPINIWAYGNLMNHYLYREGDLDGAQRVAERALYSNPGNEKVYYDLALLSMERLDLDLAVQYARQCVRHNEQMDIAWHLLWEIEAKRGGPPESAVEHLAKAVALSPGSADYHQDYAVALAQMGRAREAREHYAKARERFPGLDEKYPEYAEDFQAVL